MDGQVFFFYIKTASDPVKFVSEKFDNSGSWLCFLTHFYTLYRGTAVFLSGGGAASVETPCVVGSEKMIKWMEVSNIHGSMN